MKSWKTTCAGILGGLGSLMTASGDAKEHSIGVIVLSVAILAFGYVAKDHDVTGGGGELPPTGTN